MDRINQSTLDQKITPQMIGVARDQRIIQIKNRQRHQHLPLLTLSRR
jgi:hypothetical protein